MKPNNPYRKGSLLWSLMEDDWSDLTADQIAEVLYTEKTAVRNMIYKIKRETGYVVKYKKLR